MSYPKAASALPDRWSQRFFRVLAHPAVRCVEMDAARDPEAGGADPYARCNLRMIEAAPLARPLNLWLKVNSGMNRAGFVGEAVRAAWQRLAASGKVAAITLMTHLARAAKLQTTGPEHVVGFMWGLWVEAFNMKLVISGKLNRIDPEAIKRLLRDTYV